MKRLFYALLVLSFLSFLFSCGGGGDSAVNSEIDNTPNDDSTQGNTTAKSGLVALNGQHSINAKILIDGYFGKDAAKLSSENMWSSDGYPLQAIVDLAKVTEINSISLHHGSGGLDVSGTSNIDVYTLDQSHTGACLTDLSHYSLLATHQATKYNDWEKVAQSVVIQSRCIALSINSDKKPYTISELRINGQTTPPVANLAPVISNIDAISLLEGDIATVVVSANDPDDDLVTLSVNNLPTFIKAKKNKDRTITLTISPLNADIGTYNSISVSAVDDKGASDTRTLQLTVNDLSSMPATKITITDQVLHPADSYNIGFNRNHAAYNFTKNNNGIKKLEKMKTLTPNWGNQKMLYRIGHGPTDGRSDFDYMTGFHFQDVWGSNTSYPFDTNKYPYDDIRNGLDEAQTMGADQLHVINFGTGTPEEAAKYVSYLNNSGDLNRQTYAYGQQNVQLFELGNEISWEKVLGHKEFAATEIEYAKRAKEFAVTMRAASDVPIQIGAVLTANTSFTGNGWGSPKEISTNILDIMKKEVDFLTFHAYASPWPIRRNYASDTNSVVLPTFFGQLEYGRKIIETKIEPVIQAHNKLYGKDVYLLNSEFFSHIYEAPELTRGLFGALYAADATIMAFNHDIRGTINFCMSHGEIADSIMFFNDDPSKTTSVFAFLELLSKHWGYNILQTSAVGIPYKFVGNPVFNQTIKLNRLHFSASKKGNKTYIMVLNMFDDQDVISEIALPFTPSLIVAYELSGTQGYESEASEVSLNTRNIASLAAFNFKKTSITLLEITE